MAGTEALLEPADVVSEAVERRYPGAAGARLIGSRGDGRVSSIAVVGHR